MPSYTREQVEALVPTIWDRYYAWGMAEERPIDPGMPKTAGAKNTKNTLWAMLADIRRAWDHAPLRHEEAAALLVCGGLGYTYVAAGAGLGVHKRTMQDRYETGVGKLLHYLNGSDITYDDLDDAA